jgi:hypothetical protein
MKDPQQQLVYEAEWAHSAYRYRNFRSVEATERWTNFIVGQPWFGRSWPHMAYHPVSIFEFGGDYCSAVAVNNSIDMPARCWKKIIICHELAHLCNVDSEIFQQNREMDFFRRRAKPGAASHGKKFCSIYLKIVKHAMGLDAYRELKRNFNLLGVNYEEGSRREGRKQRRPNVALIRAIKAAAR